MTLLEKLTAKDTFTNVETAVVEYILHHKEAIATMTIATLAKESFSSNATIIRICRKLGYDGFRDFKIALVKEIESNKFITQSIDYTLPFALDESTESLIHNMSSLYKESIDLITSTLNVTLLEDVSSTILKSKRIFIIARGDAQITAMNFINKMIKINLFPILATTHYEEQSICQNVNSNDCVIFISYRADYQQNEKCLHLSKQKGAKVITISAIEDSLLVKQSDYALLIPDREHGDKIATFYSQLGFQYVLNILYSLIYKANYSINHQRIKHW